MAPSSPTTTTGTLSPTSATSPRHPQRPPPPSLFLGPPSRNASNISLPSIHPSTTHSSTTKPSKPTPPPSAPLLSRSNNRGPDSAQTTSSPLGRSSQQQQQGEHQSEGDRTDALWAEMQATLAEVELSAARRTHFFGPEHSAALEELRASQIALAQAWARSEADEIVEPAGEGEQEGGKGGKVGREDEGRAKGTGVDDETEGDIEMARKRREANDRYFWRVHGGVQDVVGKLEEVARAMGKVERESREIWSESESLEEGSGTS